MALLNTILFSVLAWTMYPPSVFHPSVVKVSPGYTLLVNLALNSFSRPTSPLSGPLTRDRVAMPTASWQAVRSDWSTRPTESDQTHCAGNWVRGAPVARTADAAVHEASDRQYLAKTAKSFHMKVSSTERLVTAVLLRKALPVTHMMGSAICLLVASTTLRKQSRCCRWSRPAVPRRANIPRFC